METGKAPDIILILNETFYDLRAITDLETDRSVMPNIDNMEGLYRGTAIIPGISGGTNATEYELLTSNSMELMPGVTPFNSLVLTGANSVVSHLKALGYNTLACHTEAGGNYSRSIGYPALGFDQVMFQDDFVDLEGYGERYYKTDESVYRNVIRWYEEMPSDEPRFLYTLTIQNHSDYNDNPPEYDIIHTLKSYGDNTERVNEFLSCISLSDQAFAYLTEYFSTVDRPVIICMLGDHAPSLAPSLVDGRYGEEEAQLRLCQVPLMVWTNYEVDIDELGSMSANMVVPTLLKIADIPLSAYYHYMLSVKSFVPIVSGFGRYYDVNGNMLTYNDDENGPYEQLVDGYFYLEYHNITSVKNRELFLP